ncbi:MAG: Crp/Fnr family transcriptional regulator [Proteobacteria bacterium]|nr:MAG: Crp/Fnr family transcriptional regulator [Pseudomonadota bacterium]
MEVASKEATANLSLPAAYLKTLSEQAVVRAFPRNAVIINEGDRADSMFIIMSGRVKVYLADESGREMLLRVQGAGEYFGEVILDDGLRSASVMTLEPCKLAVVSIEQFKAFLAANPEAAFELLKRFAQRIRELTGTVGNLALLDVYGRVARLLLDLATEQEGKLVVQDALTQQDIASRVGCSREMISRIMKDLRTGGYIQLEGERMIIAKKPPRAW